MTENSQQTHPATPEEDIKVLYGRVAKLNDIASALLAPAWGSETGIIPADHPLYVGEKAAGEEQATPVKQRADCTELEWAEQERARMERLYTRECTRAETAEAERDQLREALGAALGRASADRAALIEVGMRERARQAAIERVRKALAVRLADDECGEQERRGYHSALIDVGRALDDGDEPAPPGPTTNQPADRTAQSGVDTPGCTCGHHGKGLAWHDTTCPWRAAWQDGVLDARERLMGQVQHHDAIPDHQVNEDQGADDTAERCPHGCDVSRCPCLACEAEQAACVHPDGYEGECPCPPSCVCCPVVAAEPTKEQP